MIELKSRIFSIFNNYKSTDHFFPILREKYKKTTLTEELNISDAVRVVLKKFPILSKDISIQNIIEFKTDPDTKIKLSRLRNWISEISKSNMNIKEMEEKLEYLLLEYSNQMNLHKLEYHTGTIETLVTVSLSLIENISRLNLSQASKVLFDLNRTKLKLLKAENEAPGKEVAFINKLNQLSR